MALETRPGSSNRYYYRSTRIGQQVRKIYCGPEGCLTAISAEMMIMERTLLRRDRRSLIDDLEWIRESVASLIMEARSLTYETLRLAGYDSLNGRRLSGRPGRPRKDGMTLRERHESLLKSVDIQEACQLAASAIDRLAEFRRKSDGQFRRHLCRDLLDGASEIAGEDPLPAEQILAIAIALCRELAEITEHYCEVMGVRRTRWRIGPNPSTTEALLQRLRRRLERVA